MRRFIYVRNKSTQPSLCKNTTSSLLPVHYPQHQVSRKFLYQQRHKADQALDEAFAESADDKAVLFYLPITQNWLFQLILALILICHCSYRGVVELFRDLFDLPISVGTVHNRLQAAAATAADIN